METREQVLVDGRGLTLEDVARVARKNAPVRLAEDAKARVDRARALVDRHAGSSEAVYGINTGFGYLKNVRIEANDLGKLQQNLIRSHAVGVGAPLPLAETRALMLLRANVMATGRSGIRRSTLELLLGMLNAGVHPIIPEKGSVGASGDLAPLAHLALAMIGEGEAILEGERMPSAAALAKVGLAPAILGAKEGLCLVNGTQAMAAIGALALLDAEALATAADVIGAISLDGRRGTNVAFDPKIQAVRGHPGQVRAATNLRILTADSAIHQSHADCDAVQDPYSFRCMPQVHGASRDVLSFVRQTLAIELNAGTDNPLVFAEEGEGDALLSGGNFHGQPLAFALDFLAMATSELGNISDRRVAQLVDPASSKLPPFLIANSGLNSGFMMAQVTAAALINESRVLCAPASTDSIPTSANQEDHVSMGMTSARKARTVVENTGYVLAVELLAACQAIDLIGLTPGRGAHAAHQALRRLVPTLVEDRVLSKDIERAREFIVDGRLVQAVEAVVGDLF
ncbi:MAG: histidine ammonia-lyase [Myxococcota bacterium]